MECSAIYVTPKRKFNRNTSCSPSDASPVQKQAKESNSPGLTSPGEDQVMAALNLSEGVAEKFNLILAKLCSLDLKIEDLNTTVKSLQSKLSFTEIDIDSVKDKQGIWMKSSLTWKLIPNLLTIVLTNFKAVWKILYLEAYSRRESLKFKGIVEVSHNHATSTRSENTEDILVDFLENVLGIENAKNMWRRRPKDYCTFPEILGQRASTQARAQT